MDNYSSKFNLSCLALQWHFAVPIGALGDPSSGYTRSIVVTSPVPQQSKITLEVSVCPFCEGNDFVVQEEPTANEDVEGVYVADLVSGENLLLKQLLGSGWTIKGRYAKQYILEKTSPQPTEKDFVADAAAYLKTVKQTASETTKTGLETLKDAKQ